MVTVLGFVPSYWILVWFGLDIVIVIEYWTYYFTYFLPYCVVSYLVKLIHFIPKNYDICWKQLATDVNMCCVKMETIIYCFCFDKSSYYVYKSTYS